MKSLLFYYSPRSAHESVLFLFCCRFKSKQNCAKHQWTALAQTMAWFFEHDPPQNLGTFSTKQNPPSSLPTLFNSDAFLGDGETTGENQRSITISWTILSKSNNNAPLSDTKCYYRESYGYQSVTQEYSNRVSFTLGLAKRPFKEILRLSKAYYLTELD